MIETTSLRRIDDGNVIDALNAAWRAAGHDADLVALSLDDDAMYMWFTRHTSRAFTFAKRFLLGYSQPASAHAATDHAGNPVGFTASGLRRIARGAAFFGVPFADPRAPDLVGIAQHGVVYTGGTGKIAEHGGADPEDRHVPIVVYGAGVTSAVSHARVETTQIAPTILTLLGLPPGDLQAVAAQGTPALPGF